MQDREFPQNPRIGVGIVLMIDKKLLLAKRKNPPAAQKWSLPGGLVELGETVKDAVRREALEETGLTIEVGKLLEVVELIDKAAEGNIRYHYILLDYLASASGGTLKAGSDVSALKLFDWRDLQKLELPILTREFIARHKNLLFPTSQH